MGFEIKYRDSKVYIIEDPLDKNKLFLANCELKEDYNEFLNLMKKIENFAMDKKIKEILIPFNKNILSVYRWITGSSDNPLFFLEPFNPPYYPEFVEKYGFKRIGTYYSVIVENFNKIFKIFKKYPIFNNIQEFKNSDVKVIYRITKNVFSPSVLSHFITFKNLIKFYEEIKNKIDFELTFIYNNKEGKGFIFGYTDPFDKQRAILKTLAVESKDKRIVHVLVRKFYERAIDKGARCVIHALMSKNSSTFKISKKVGKIFREYGLWVKKI